MTQQAILLVLLPLIAAFALGPLRRCNPIMARLLAPAILLSHLLLSLTLWPVISQHGAVTITFGGFAAPLGIAFHVDMLALIFTSAIAGLGLLLWPWRMSSDSKEPTLYLLLVAGSSGIALSGDLFNLYVFFEVVAVASYALVAAENRAQQLLASLRFLLLGAAGSALALLGIGMLYAKTGTLNLAHLGMLGAEDPTLFGTLYGQSAFLLILLGFGVKAELFPLNSWVPEVYGVCRSRICGLLAGVVSKLALLIILRLLLQVFAETSAAHILLVVGVLTLLVGEFAAYRATNLRALLGYSSIGQMGLVAICFSVNNEAGVVAGLAVALNHLLVKPALFLYADGWREPLNALWGRALQSPYSSALFVLLVLSLIGIPPLPGFWAKYLLLKATLGADQGYYQLAAAAVLLATLVETAYFMRLINRLYAQPEETTMDPRPSLEMHNRVRVSVLAGLLLLFTFTIGTSSALLKQSAQQAVDTTGYRQQQLPAGVAHLGPVKRQQQRVSP